MSGGQQSRRYTEELKRRKEVKDDEAALFNRSEEGKSEEL
jgi:hypothetical protein